MMRKKIAWVDCGSGIAGNMLLGALIDLGFPGPSLQELVKVLGLGKVKIEIKKESRQEIAGVLVRIIPQNRQKPRKLKEIISIINRAKIPEPVKTRSRSAFKLLAQAEAGIHSVSPDQVHFHELGAVDTILDIVGAISGFDQLGVTRIYFSRIRLGGGEIKCAHGILPVPAPATLELLKGLPVVGGAENEGELATPTGAALARELGENFGPMPEMKIEKTGYGLGERELLTRPNLLRIVLGSAQTGTEELMQLEAAIDDMNPEYYDPMMRAILKAGALEIALIPAHLKKNRLGVILRALCSNANLEKVISAAFNHSTTTGLRFYPVNRVSLSRRILPVKTPYGQVRVKKIELPGGGCRIHPEFEDLRKISNKRQIPLIILEQEVIKEWAKRKPRNQK